MCERRATGYQIETLNGGISLTLPTLIEWHTRQLWGNSHTWGCLLSFSSQENCCWNPSHRWWGSNTASAWQRNSTSPQSWATDERSWQHTLQKIDLGWVLVGDVCLGDVHWPTVHSQLVKDKYFLRIMNKDIFHYKSKSWVAPLPSKAISSKQLRTSYDSPLFSKTH